MDYTYPDCAVEAVKVFLNHAYMTYTRAFNDSDDLMESLGNTRTGINFVMVDGQGTLIGTGSNDKSLMKSM